MEVRGWMLNTSSLLDAVDGGSGFSRQECWWDVLVSVVFQICLLVYLAPAGIARDACHGGGGTRASSLSSSHVETSAGASLSLFLVW